MQQHTVLLVDDEELLRRLLARMLEEAGHIVVEADNGQTALRASGDLDGSLSLVVTDIHMPVMDGLQFAREFRPLHPTVPILFITGRDSGLTVDPALLNGTLLCKPFRAEAFLAEVSKLL